MKTLLYKLLITGIFIGMILSQFARIPLEQSTTITLLDISVCLFVFFWIITEKPYVLFSHSLAKPFLLFAGICVFSLVVNYGTYTNSQILIAFLYTLRWATYGLVFFAVADLPKKLKKYIHGGMILSGLSLLLIGFVQIIFYSNLRNLFYLGWDDHRYRLFATFLDPNFAGIFFVLYFLFLGGWFFKLRNELKKIIVVGVLLFATLVGIFLTYSRSAFITLVVSSFIFVILIGKKRWMYMLITLLTLGIFLVSPLFYIENLNLFRTASSEARVETAKNALTIFMNNPIFGIGFNAYRYAQIDLGVRGGRGARVSHADAGADNSFLFVAATTGVLGLTAYVYFLFRLFCYSYEGFKKKHFVFGAVVSASLIGLSLNSLFINSLFYPPLLLWFYVLIGTMDYT